MRCSWRGRSGRPVRQRSSSSSSCSNHSSKKEEEEEKKSITIYLTWILICCPGTQNILLIFFCISLKWTFVMFLSLHSQHLPGLQGKGGRGCLVKKINIVYIWIWVQLIFCHKSICCNILHPSYWWGCFEGYTAHFNKLKLHILP